MRATISTIRGGEVEGGEGEVEGGEGEVEGRESHSDFSPCSMFCAGL